MFGSSYKVHKHILRKELVRLQIRTNFKQLLRYKLTRGKRDHGSNMLIAFWIFVKLCARRLESFEGEEFDVASERFDVVVGIRNVRQVLRHSGDCKLQTWVFLDVRKLQPLPHLRKVFSPNCFVASIKGFLPMGQSESAMHLLKTLFSPFRWNKYTGKSYPFNRKPPLQNYPTVIMIQE